MEAKSDILHDLYFGLELVQVEVSPSHDYLYRIMQVSNGAIAANQQSPPDGWADFPKPKPKLVDKHFSAVTCHISNRIDMKCRKRIDAGSFQ